MKEIDLIFDSYGNEFELGRKRIFIPMSMARIEDASESNPQNRMYKPVFDSRDCVFYALDIEGAQKPIDISFPLRTAEHQTGLRDTLNILSLKCGMGTDRYSFEAGGVKTATEVISEKSDLFQNFKKHEKTLTEAILGMVQALAFLSNEAVSEIKVMYDDGIINDDNTKIDNNIKLVQAELKSKTSAIMDIYGVSETDAQKELDKIIEENRSVSGSDIDLFGGDSNEVEEDPEKIPEENEEKTPQEKQDDES